MRKQQAAEAQDALPTSLGSCLADLKSFGLPFFEEDLGREALLNKVIRHLEVQKSCGDPRATICLEHPHIWFEPQVERQEVLRPMGFCYQSAGQQAFDDSTLVYVEGFAIRNADLPLPQAHAWVVTPEGKVVDSTWSKAAVYFGVPIATQALARCVGETGCWGLFSYLMPRWFMDTPQSWLANI